MNFRPRSVRQRSSALVVLSHIGFAGLLFAVALLFCGPAAAQTDPPGRVARLSEASGSVWFYHPDNGEWAEALRNLPLTTGDRLAADPGSRAELQVGTTTLRLDGGSELEIVALDDTRIALQLHAGTLATRVRSAAEAGQVDVLTDDGRFLVLRAGGYRFDRGTRSSFVAVESGEVRYEHAGTALNIGPGQRGEFWLEASGAAQYALLPNVSDAFTAWNADRDRAFDRSVASRYVSPEMTGVEDLDRYGTWEQTPDYGAVWYPTAVGPDWAPYSTGRWAWVSPWGWTWVDDAPWGFAPFHYGRWVNVRNRWCWTPGVRQPRPVWAPALVGWVGGGAPSAGPRGGGPAVGWFPLGPREVYVPGYASTPRYVRSINETHVRNPALVTAAINDPRSARDFENRRFPHAITVVPATVMAERRPIGPPVAQFRDAPGARDFAQRGALTVSAPPVPPPALRGGGDVRRPPGPPPGFAAAGAGRPREAFAERDAPRQVTPSIGGTTDPRLPAERANRDRDRDRDRDGDGRPDRFQPPGWAGRGQGPGVGPGPEGRPNGVPSPQAPPVGIARPLPQAPTGVQPGSNVSGPGDRPDGSVARAPRFEGRPPAESGVQQPRQPMPEDAAQSPRMRTMPVRRGDDPRIREEALPSAARPDLAPGLRRAAPPIEPMRPMEAARPMEPPRAIERVAPIQPVRPQVVAPRAPEPQQSPRLAPPGGGERPQPRPAEAQRPAESPRVNAPERRNEPGNSR